MNNPSKPENTFSAVSLTPAQERAIGHQVGEMVVLAGAGSGKTAALANRCAELVTGDPDACDVRELLVLTFTREAADEMRSRIAQAIRRAADARADDRRKERLNQQAILADNAQISTFHAFCNWVAKTWFMFCRVDPGFTLLNEHESAMMQTDAIQDAARIFMNPEHRQHDGFIEIFDLYAGASLDTLETLIWPVLRTMETVEDPDTWCRHAANTDNAEIQKILETFIGKTGRRLEELAIMLASSADDAVFDADGKKFMHSGLYEAGKAARAAADALRQPTASGWQNARNIMDGVTFAKQILLAGTQDKPSAEHFKEEIYQPLKKAFETLRKELTGSDIANLLSLETISRQRIGVILEFVQCVQRQYQQAKQSRHALDYSDLERTIIEALSTPDNPLKSLLHQRFRHILVDEYQDINPVQQKLIALLYRGEKPAEALKPGSLFGVGDVLQSIYGFRGSEPRILYDKVKHIQAGPQSHNVITMRENFRTLPALIDALNAIFSPMLRMVERDATVNAMPMVELAKLQHGRKAAGPGDFPGIPVALHVLTDTTSTDSAPTDTDSGEAEDAADTTPDDPSLFLHGDELEAAKIGELIRDMLRSGRTVGPDSRPLELKDIAILLRAPSQRAPHYVRTLISMGIAANAALATGFFESSEVLEVLDILKVLDNPAQDIALAGVLMGPVGGCTAVELALIRKLQAKDIPFHQAVVALSSDTYVDNAQRVLQDKINHALTQLEHWRAATRTETLVHAIAQIIQEAGLLNRAAAMPDGHQRVANVRLLQQRAMEFSGFELQSLSRFLNFFQRLREERDLGEAAPPAGNAVRIMSIHGSKGLEFSVVFVAGLGTEFNQHDLQHQLLVDRDRGIGMQILDANGVLTQDTPGYQILADEKCRRLLQEEARLLYVAMTRARDQLVLLGRMAESKLEKCKQIHLPGTSSSGNQAPPLKSIKCPLNWLIPIFTQYQKQSTAEPLLVLPESQENSAVKQSTETVNIRKAAADLAVCSSQEDSGGQGTAVADTLKTMLHRITQPYPFRDLTFIPAVSSVSRLKSLIYNDVESPAFIMDATPPAIRLEMNLENSGVKLGLIMHRVLQRLDFTHTSSEVLLHEALERLVTQSFLTAEERALVDDRALLWLFSTPLGQRLRNAAIQHQKEHQVLREVSFLWSIPAAEAARDSGVANPPSASRATWEKTTVRCSDNESEQMLIRGTIDALLIEPDQIEVVDYKTDAPASIPSRLAAYQQQVSYYARAAEMILKKPVRRTSLVFISARQIESRVF